MNLHKLRKREELKNRLEFPLKCAEHDLKLFFDNKKADCKDIYKNILNKIKKEYNKNKIKSNHLIEYIYNIDNRIFNSNLHPSENNILENLYKYYDMIKEFQECKGRLLIEDKEKLEAKVSILFKKEEKRENKALKNMTEEIMYGFDIYDKLKNEFLENRNNYDNPVHEFDNLIQEKRYLKSELELVKSLNLKLKKMLKRIRNKKKFIKI